MPFYFIFQKLWLRLLLPILREAVTLICLRLATTISQWGVEQLKKFARKRIQKLTHRLGRAGN